MKSTTFSCNLGGACAVLLVLLMLPGCSLLPAAVGQVEQTAATAMVESSERTICRNIPVGTWMRLYGAHPERRAAWRSLCAPAQETPQ